MPAGLRSSLLVNIPVPLTQALPLHPVRSGPPRSQHRTVAAANGVARHAVDTAATDKDARPCD